MRGRTRDPPTGVFGAVVVDWDSAVTADSDLAGTEVGQRIGALLRWGTSIVVATSASVEQLLGQLPRCAGTPGRLLTAMDPGAVHTALEALDREGIGSGLVLVVCAASVGPDGPLGEVDALLTGHPRLTVARLSPASVGLLELLDDQLSLLRLGRVPGIDPDPRWVIADLGDDPMHQRVRESLLCLSSGGLSARGSVEEDGLGSAPMLLADGVWSGPAVADGLLEGPDPWSLPTSAGPIGETRVLDLHTGVLLRDDSFGAGRWRSLRFASLRHPGVFVERVECPPGHLREEQDEHSEQWWTKRADVGGIGTLVRDRTHHDDVDVMERFASVDARRTRRPVRSLAARRLDRAADAGFGRLLWDQRRDWAGRWRRAGIELPDAPRDELGLRLALFHLWSLVGGSGDLPIGARGRTGQGYSGHVFWDADVFVLPALATLDPSSARRMVDYRVSRLPQARERAATEGCEGARFPWESARTGADVTPARGLLGGQPVAIRTGVMEEHITADVAWSVVHQATWGRQDAHLDASERELLVETARYWCSRSRTDPAGRMHIDGVIGPDEYHEDIDDNAYTNGLARWNLRAAAELAGPAVDPDERSRWIEVADRLVDGFDPVRGGFEQFRGYSALEPLDVGSLPGVPCAADVVLGRARVSGSQLVKQPDVLMLHHVLPDLAPDARTADLDLYLPRTCHGSSLSPAVTASVLARAGRPDEALELLRLSLDLDLHDRTGTTSAGVHIGAAAGAWQAVVLGFVGACVRGGVLCLSPVLPVEWPRLEAHFQCLGNTITVAVDGRADRLTVRSTGSVTIRVGDQPPIRLRANRPWSTAWTARPFDDMRGAPR